MPKKKEENHINFGWIFRTVLVVIGLLIIGAAVFFVFTTRIKAKQALRDAKNVYLALTTTEIEYYASGKTIYDPVRANGLASGVADRVKNLVDNEGSYKILSFDQATHRIHVLEYQNGRYYVLYYGNGDRNVWEVSYRMPIYHFDDID
ncbi:MAG: hypothetical protein IKI20_07155 [Lachnospiraceae bacterium]|nr:hypothetical protein [Lachnospiraceae bacterium]